MLLTPSSRSSVLFPFSGYSSHLILEQTFLHFFLWQIPFRSFLWLSPTFILFAPFFFFFLLFSSIYTLKASHTTWCGVLAICSILTEAFSSLLAEDIRNSTNWQWRTSKLHSVHFHCLSTILVLEVCENAWYFVEGRGLVIVHIVLFWIISWWLTLSQIMYSDGNKKKKKEHVLLFPLLIIMNKITHSLKYGWLW